MFLVGLAEIEDAGLVPSVIASALAIPREPDRAVLDSLVDHLRPRRLLLVLDNLEHLPEAARPIASLLDAAPGLVVLATSRAPLRLAGEQEYPLAPLPVHRGHDPEHLSLAGDAVALFADRATAVDPRFRIGPHDVPVVAEVVARLDGLPLAIELAAPRVRLFPLDELERRLRPALPLLTGGVDEHPRQHTTLRSAIAWSDELLEPPERALLRRLAVFRGGITLAAAEAVAGHHPVTDVVERLSRLVEVSLVGRPDDADPPRVAMLGTVREYGREQLAKAAEEREVQERYARYHVALIRDAAPRLTQAGQGEWLARLDIEQPDLRAALGWAIEVGHADLALEMASGLWRYWQLRGHLVEGRRWLEDTLAIDGASPLWTVRGLLGYAGICYWQFDLGVAETAYRRARVLASDVDDRWLELESLFGLVVTLVCHRGDLDEAAHLEDEFQRLAAEQDDPVAVGLSLATSQMMRLLAGDLDGSRHYGELVLAGTRQLGERWYEVQILRTLALASLRQEQYERAHDELRDCVEIAHELGDLPGMAMDLDRLGQVAAVLGDPERACVLAGAADRLRESAGAQITR